MMEFISNFHFLRPWGLLFLILPLLLRIKKIKPKSGASSWEDICDEHLLNFLLVEKTNAKKISLTKFIYVGLIFASIALAGPSWKKIEVPSFDIENPNIFVLSLTQDMLLDDISPSRLERSKFMISDLAQSVKQGQFGLEVYTVEPYMITPITDDINLIANLLPQITPNIVPDHGDRLDRAIDYAVVNFKNANYLSGNIILIASDIGQRFDKAIESVEKARKQGYNVNIIDASYSGNDKLKMLADKGNGLYIKLITNDISPLVKKISEVNDEKMKLSLNFRSTFEDFGYYLLIIPLLSILIFFRRGILVLAFVIVSLEANAGVWLNDNQEGLKLFREEKYDDALSKFKDKLWRSITFYRLDKLEDALKEIDDKDSEISLYNKGVILAKLCKYNEAKNIFDKVVSLYPDNEDAKYNKKILDDLFEEAKKDPKVLSCDDNQQQNQQQNQPQNNKEQKEDKEEKQNSSDKNENKSNEEQQNKQEDNKKDNNKQNEKEQNAPQDDNHEKNKNDENKEGNNSEDSKSDKSQEQKKDNNEKSTNEDNDSQAKDSDSNDEKSDEMENRKQEADAPVLNAKKTDKKEDFDEEALIMQRRYREIPEDTGGLLREFIKKEYLKDRYRNENI
ncbi:MAG: hypothetical protein IKW58_03555 [Alphaproteobacteria bacterium]|nr:hypothetical protein [Alphaproteobacteria bacterium]